MAEHFKKLKWERVNDSFALKAANVNELDIKRFRKLLYDVERPTPDYNKPFSSRASKLFNRWFNNNHQALQGAAYALLSNWFLTGSQAAKKSRAKRARNLWDSLFCAVPKRRLTIPKRNYKIVEEEFDFWWPQQVKCQMAGQ